ncbi:MAG: MFS transporter [Pseudomonas sp.]
MFNESEYQLTWMVYLGAAVCAWLVWWKMTAWIRWWFVREPLWLVMAVILFTPVRVDPMEPWLAPASIIWLLDTVLNTGDNQARMLGDLALALGVAVVAYLVFVGLRFAWWHWREREPVEARGRPKGHYRPS